jgi:hypothetical protein
MAVDYFNSYVERKQKEAREYKQKIPSSRELLQCLGFDEAEKLQMLEAYRDAWGLNFKRSENAWQENWDTIYPNSAYYGRT